MRNVTTVFFKMKSIAILSCIGFSLSACYMGFAPRSDPCTVDPKNTGSKLCDAETIRLFHEKNKQK